ncbi:MAG: thiamine pyrophosphate-dependent enzyme [Ilumatobacteraceae bacterium]
MSSLLADRGDTLVVTGLGSSTYDVHAAGDDDANYYLWGAMGAAALVGFGLAIGQPGRRVLVITGDGEQLMALGSLATIAVAAPSNLDIVVLDNERYGETGMQTSHTGHGLDLASVAAACGFPSTGVVRRLDELERLDVEIRSANSGPSLHVVKILPVDHPRSMPSRDAVFVKNRFRAQLGLAPN